MPHPTHITVTAPPGRQTPIHRLDGMDPTGGQLCAMPGWIVRVRFGSSDIRRAINRGDLIPCDMQGNQVASAELAASPVELEGGKIAITRRTEGGKP